MADIEIIRSEQPTEAEIRQRITDNQAKRINRPESDRYCEINRQNMTCKVPVKCPACESLDTYRDKERSDHPGSYACRNCDEMIAC